MVKQIEPIDSKFIESFEIDEWQVDTEDGWKDITHIHKTIEYDVWEIKTKSFSLKCADDHIVMDYKFRKVFVKNLKQGDKILTKNGIEAIISVKKLDTADNMYDVTVNSDTHTLYTNGILSHNTTIFTIYILWFILFNRDKTVAVLGHQEKLALEILEKIKFAYKNLPLWLQVGVVEGGWNKSSISIENGCRVIAAATGSESVTGFTISCLTGKNKVTIQDKETGEIIETTIDNLRNLLEDNIVNIIKNTKYTILTPNGFKDFDGLYISDDRDVLEIELEDCLTLECTPDHKIFVSDDDKIEAKYLKINQTILTKNGNKRIKQIYNIFDKKRVYDIINVKDGSRFYANEILVSNCLYLDEFAKVPKHVAEEFITSTYPVISSGKTSKILMASTSKGLNLFYEFWTRAVKGLNNFYPIRVGWWEVPGRDNVWKEKMIRDIGKLRFSQEFQCFSSQGIVNIRNKYTNEIRSIKISELFDNDEYK